jgi:hypothetical protein
MALSMSIRGYIFFFHFLIAAKGGAGLLEMRAKKSPSVRVTGGIAIGRWPANQYRF